MNKNGDNRFEKSPFSQSEKGDSFLQKL